MQVFVRLLFNTVMAGAIAPLYGSALTLAIGSTIFVLIGYFSWRGYMMLCADRASRVGESA